MRTFIESIMRLNRPTLFFGASTSTLPESEVLLTTFDRATYSGRFVYEGTIDLSTTSYLEDEHGFRISDPSGFEVLHVYDTHCPDAFIESTIVRTLREYSPEPGSHLVFVTGILAKAGLERVLNALTFEDISFEIRVMDIAVAAWLTNDDIINGIGDLSGVDLVVIPGKVTGDDSDLEQALGVTVMRGPTCYSELPEFFEQAGVEIETVGNVRPKVIVLGPGGLELSQQIANTYEVPFLDSKSIVQAGIDAKDEAAILASRYISNNEAVPHYLMAELIRARMIEPDVRNGFVLFGYPATIRDTEWLIDMRIKPDSVININDRELGNNEELVVHYSEQPGFIEVDGVDPAAASEIFTKLETMLQTCVMASDNS